MIAIRGKYDLRYVRDILCDGDTGDTFLKGVTCIAITDSVFITGGSMLWIPAGPQLLKID